MPRINADKLNLEERVIRTNKVQKTHKGGRTMSWNALVVVGDSAGHVGVGLGKARGVPDAIRKGVEDAKKSIIEIPLLGTTVPHEVLGQAGASLVMLKPAAPGTGVVAGGSVRAILEVAGVRDVLAKSLGAPNAINTARATMNSLTKLKKAEDVAKLRGKSLEELLPKGILNAIAASAATKVEAEPKMIVEAVVVAEAPVAVKAGAPVAVKAEAPVAVKAEAPVVVEVEAPAEVAETEAPAEAEVESPVETKAEEVVAAVEGEESA